MLPGAEKVGSVHPEKSKTVKGIDGVKEAAWCQIRCEGRYDVSLFLMSMTFFLIILQALLGQEFTVTPQREGSGDLKSSSPCPVKDPSKKNSTSAYE